METRQDAGKTAVRARGLVARYGQVTALADLDIDLHAGSVTTLLGPNGAGKTTLVGLMLGLRRADGGSLEILGVEPGSLAARRRTGAMLQTAGLAPTLSVREHVALHAAYYPASRPIEETLALAGLAELADRRYDALSGGEQRRVQFALAICGRPDLVVLDEPTVGLDPESRRTLWSVVRELADGGAAVLLTTHHLQEVEALSDRVVLLARGRVLADGTPAAIRDGVSARVVRCLTHLPDERLRALPAVSSIERAGRHALIRTRSAEMTLRALLAADDRLADLEVSGASLEDAILDLTRREAA